MLGLETPFLPRIAGVGRNRGALEADRTQILDLDMTFEDDFPDPTPMRPVPASRMGRRDDDNAVAGPSRQSSVANSLATAIAEVLDEPVFVGFGEKVAGGLEDRTLSASTSTMPLKRVASQTMSNIPKRAKPVDDFYARRVADSDRRNSLGRSPVIPSIQLPTHEESRRRERSESATTNLTGRMSIGPESHRQRPSDRSRQEADRTAQDRSFKTVIELRSGGVTQTRTEPSQSVHRSSRQSSIPIHRSRQNSPAVAAPPNAEAGPSRLGYRQSLKPMHNPLADLAISPIRPRSLGFDVSAIIDVEVDAPDLEDEEDRSTRSNREPTEESARPKSASPTLLTAAEQDTSGVNRTAESIRGQEGTTTLAKDKVDVTQQKPEPRRTSLLGYLSGLLNRSTSAESLASTLTTPTPAKEVTVEAEAVPVELPTRPISQASNPPARPSAPLRKPAGPTLTRPLAPSFARRPLQPTKMTTDSNVPRSVKPTSTTSGKPISTAAGKIAASRPAPRITRPATQNTSKVAAPPVRRPATTSSFASAALARLPPPGKGSSSAAAPVTIRDAERARDIAIKRAVFERLASTNTESSTKSTQPRASSAARPSMHAAALVPTVPVTGRTPGKASRARAEARAQFDEVVRENERRKEEERRNVERIRKDVEAGQEKVSRMETVVWAAPLPPMYGSKM